MRAALIPILFPRRLTGGLALLGGAGTGFPAEPQGLGIDFTTVDGLASVAVKDTTTPGNSLSNAPADSFLTQSGTSPKLVLWSDGLYRWSPHNLILRSEDFGNAAWVNTGGLGSRVGNTLTDPDASNNVDFRQSVTVIAGASYVWTLWIVKDADQTRFPEFDLYDGTTEVAVRVNTQTGAIGNRSGTAPTGNNSVSVTSDGANWKVVIVNAAVASSTLQMLISPAASATVGAAANSAAMTGSVTLAKAQLNRGTTPAAYHVTTSAAWFGVPIEYDPVTAKFYALVEPAATNLALQSSAADTTWSVAGGASIVANTASSPMAVTDADSLVESGASTIFANYQTGSFGSAGTYTFTRFVKAVGRTFAYLSLLDGTDTNYVTAIFDLTTLTSTKNWAKGNWTFVSASVGPSTNGFYRLVITATTSGSLTQIKTGSVDSNNPTQGTFGDPAAFTGINATALYMWQADLITGSVANSPIPTFAATVTRSADNLTVATSAFPSVAAVGSFIAVVNTSLPTAGPRLTQLTDGTNNERNLTGLNSSLQSTQAVVHGGSVQATQHSTNTTTASVTFKVASAWQAGDMAQVLNGGTPATGAPAAMATGLTTLYLGRDFDAAPLAPLRISTFVALPRRMTNAELQARTAP